MTAQIIDIAGQKMAVLPEAEYRQLVEAAEDVADVEAAIRADERHKAGEEYIPFSMTEAMIKGQSPLRVWREHRGLSIEALAAKAGVPSEDVRAVESGADTGARNWHALAKALSVDIEDIIPLD